MTPSAWHDRESLTPPWHDAVAQIVQDSRAPAPVTCPICGRASLRYFFLRFRIRPDEQVGGWWIWCPSCRTFEHARGRVPAWWTDVELPKGRRLLTTPDWLDDHYSEYSTE